MQFVWQVTKSGRRPQLLLGLGRVWALDIAIPRLLRDGRSFRRPLAEVIVFALARGLPCLAGGTARRA
jgi:hypothetical protein